MLNVKILVVKAHVLVAVFFIANNERKLWNNVLGFFSPQFSWSKETLFIAPNMIPSRELLYNSSSTISMHFKGLKQMSSIFVCFKKLYFQMRFFLTYYSYSNLKFRKSFLTSDLFATISWNIYGQYHHNETVKLYYKCISKAALSSGKE